MPEHARGAMRRATTTGATLGTLVASALLVILALIVAPESGSALKSLVAVWLAALPILGLGALCGWLIGLGFAGNRRSRRAGR